MQNVVGPTLVAMATKFGLGLEIQSPTGLSVCLSVCLLAEYLKNYERIFIKFSGWVGHDQRKNQLDYGGNRDSFVDPGSFFRIL